MKKETLYIFFFLFCGILSAQEPLRFTTKQGLPSNHIYDIQEDANGFMWFATNRGLVKYNGENFKTFTIKDGLPNNDTWLLETDYQDRLWYFSKSNYQGYIKKDSIYKFPVEDNLVISPRFIHKSKEKFWLHSNGGYHVLQKDTLKNYDSLKTKWFVELNNKLNTISKKYNFKTSSDGVAFNPKTKEVLVVKKNELLFFDEDYKLIKQLPIFLESNHKNNKIFNLGLLYNQIFYYGLENGILFVDFKTKTSKYIDFKELVNVESIKYIRLKGLKDQIQVSFPGHLLTFNSKLEFKKSYSFSENLGRMSYKDSKGNIWLGDFTNGISLIPNTQIETNYFLLNKKVQKLNKIDSIFYAGINDDGFYQMNKSENKFNQFLKFKRANGEIYHLNKDDSGSTYFISTANSYIKKNTTINDLVLNNKGLNIVSQSSLKNSIYFNNDNYNIAGSYVVKSDSDFNFVSLFSKKEGLLTSVIFKNKLFFGGANGLNLVKNDTLVQSNTKHSLLQASIASFLATKENLFVGTDGRGVYIYNDDNIIHLKNTDGFSVQKIIQIENHIWLATEKGVHQIKLNINDLENSKTINSFYEADGLLQNNTNDIYLEKDTLFAASDVGISRLNITNNIYTQKPNIYFKTKNDTLSYVNEKRDNITINFSALNYLNQDNLNYQYRLLPNQTEWKTTTTRTLNFSNLSPELHELQVKATDQHFNTTTISQFVNIVPTWWQTTLAKIGFILLAVLGFLGFAKVLQKRIQAKEQAKAQLDKKIAGLELQALRSQMNPHFVHNSLNAIQYFVQRNEVEHSENYLVKFSKLVRLFFEYSRKQNISIQEEISLLNNYLEIEKLRFEDKLSYQIKVDKTIDTEEQIIPSMMLQPIVENAVNHGLFHKKENGLVTILFKKINEKSFKVIVEDDGIGINKSKEMYKDSSKNYQSKSSAVLEERLELLQQSNDWKIKYSIQDLSKVNNANGTRVTLIFNQPML